MVTTKQCEIEPRHGGGVSAPVARILLVLAVWPAAGEAQERATWKRDFTVGVATSFDSNVFLLSEFQKADLGTGSDRYADMLDHRDITTDLVLGGELRRGSSSGRLRLGLVAKGEIYSQNTRRTNMSVASYVSQRLGKRNELIATLEINPSEFRRNYLSGADPFDGPVYQEGVATGLRGQLAYSRRLVGGGGPDLDLTVGVLGASRSVELLPWRDRSELGGVLELDAKLSKRFDLGFEATRSRSSYDGGSQPVLISGQVSTMELLRDFDQTEFSLEFRFDLTKRSRLDLEYGRRARDYIAEPGTDPIYGGRADTRHTFRAQVRQEISKRLDLRFGGKLRQQDTFRPALGSVGYDEDYSRFVMTLQLKYSR